MQTHNPFAFLRYWCEYLDTLGDILVRGDDGQRTGMAGASALSRHFGIVPRHGG